MRGGGGAIPAIGGGPERGILYMYSCTVEENELVDKGIFSRDEYFFEYLT